MSISAKQLAIIMRYRLCSSADKDGESKQMFDVMSKRTIEKYHNSTTRSKLVRRVVSEVETVGKTFVKG